MLILSTLTMKGVQLCWIVHNEAQTDAGAGISQAGISQVTQWWPTAILGLVCGTILRGV